jgi:hypothetical protein
MANTNILNDILSPKLLLSLQQKARLKAYCDIRGDFTAGMGDSLRVPIFPTFDAEVGGVAGSDIVGTNIVIDEAQLDINRRATKLVTITEWEKWITNYSLQDATVAEMYKAIARKEEDYIIQALLDATGTDINTTGTLATENATTIYESILQFKEIFENKGTNTDGEGEIVVTVNHNINKILKTSELFDATDSGLRTRMAGLGIAGTMLDGNIHIIASGRIPQTAGAGGYSHMIGFRRGACAFGNGALNFKVTDNPKAFSANVLFERMFGTKVLGTPNNDSVAVKYVTNRTTQTAFAPAL